MDEIINAQVIDCDTNIDDTSIVHEISLFQLVQTSQRISQIKEKSLFDVIHCFISSRHKVHAVMVWWHIWTVHVQHISYVLFNVIHLVLIQ